MNVRLRALVVDDEPPVRRVTVKALENHAFFCDEASDGEHALALLAQRKYDVVLTDLRMPRKHGHALAVELLSRGAERPVVVVLTGVLEPRLAADLVARGVDEVAFKPVDYDLLVPKIRALCFRHRQTVSASAGPSRPATSAAGLVPVSFDQMEKRLDGLAGSLPVSHAAIEVVNLIQEGTPSVEEVARCIARDPMLTVEVLRLANSAYHNPTGKRIDDLQQAIARVGDRQIAELALASTTMNALSATSLTWIDPEGTWRRSLATSLAIRKLHPAAELGGDDEGLFLSSLLLPMSRVLLGLGFPELYRQMVAHCQKTHCTLASLEQQLLPITPPRALAGMLARWNLSPRLVKPLQQAGYAYAEIATLSDPLRSKAERLRLAELLGQMAAGYWEDWDEIVFPPPETLRRLRVDALDPIVAQARSDLAQFPAASHGKASRASSAGPARLPGGQVPYFKLGVEPHDLLATLLESLKVPLVRTPREVIHQPRPSLVNCLDASAERFEWFLDDCIPDSRRVLVCNGPLPPHCESWGPVIQLPCSYRMLRDAVVTATSGP
jgi:HD-like signal output (HDOD) protein/FixJ family two-component response regulator